jgi:hypothetical protein
MKKFSTILDVFFEHKKIADIQNIKHFWKDIIYDAFLDTENSISSEIITRIADNSEVSKITDDKIIIETNHSGWIQMMLTKQDIILDIMKQKYNMKNIKEIMIVLKKSMNRRAY